MATHDRNEELPQFLSAKFKDSFAYTTIKDRLPVILTKVADTVYRAKNKIREENGDEAADELKVIVGHISRLRHQIQTNKAVEVLHDSGSDLETWNQCFGRLVEQNSGQPIKWFHAPWIFLECYMYRRIQEAVSNTKHLKGLDVFEEQKQKAYHQSDGAITTLLTYLLEVTESVHQYSPEQRQQSFEKFLKVALWGNKCDLSISASQENAQKDCVLTQLKSLTPNILIDDSADVIKSLEQTCDSRGGAGRLDIILDNAGFELITDLCLAEFLISSGLASSVHLHGKAMPWFISDVTQADLQWTLRTMCSTNNLAVSSFGAKWQERLQNGSWMLKCDDFWTSPHIYSMMKKHACDLYNDLSRSDLLVFKGDLNYRKLVGDMQWEHTTSFSTALDGFQPAPLCSLRTLKADVVVGLKPKQAEHVKEQDKNWLINGNWAIISFHSSAK